MSERTCFVKIPFLALLVFAAIMSCKQEKEPSPGEIEVRVHGKLIDEYHETPIPGWKIELRQLIQLEANKFSDKPVDSVFTDENGEYEIVYQDSPDTSFHLVAGFKKDTVFYHGTDFRIYNPTDEIYQDLSAWPAGSIELRFINSSLGDSLRLFVLNFEGGSFGNRKFYLDANVDTTLNWILRAKENYLVTVRNEETGETIFKDTLNLEPFEYAAYQLEF